MFVDAFLDSESQVIHVVERVGGARILKEFKPSYTFYYEHPDGRHQSIFGNYCKKFVTSDRSQFRRELAIRSVNHKIFESDINPVFRLLAEKYMGADTPKLQIGFFDIEVGFHPDKGYATVEDPFNPVTAISIYLKWLGEMITLALKPPTLSLAEAEDLVAEFPNTAVFEDEADLLDQFLAVIEDVDVLSGWSSETYDIPYLVNRIKRLLGDDAAKRLCLMDQMPRVKKVTKFRKERLTFELFGRVHLDYLALYQKHNPQQLHSYRLDYVGEIEVGENKVPYEGTLDALYKYDFKQFVAYSRQDVALLDKIDTKKKFIELANQIAHANCVLLITTMGSVALVETAIAHEMHALGFIIPDRKPKPKGKAAAKADHGASEEEEEDEEAPVVGAYVAKPKTGIHDMIGCVDLNSLYPSTLRAMNASPETIFGQFRSDLTDALVAERIEAGIPRAEAWDGLFHTLEYGHVIDRTDTLLTVDFEDGTVRTMTGAEWADYIFDPASHVCLSANGTLFRTDKDGMIPALLGKWYAQRKEMQGKEKHFAAAAKAEGISEDERKALENEKIFWNQRQQARKILLNSLYGALLNSSCRFYDERLGQTTTLTGRSIARHMNAKINEVITDCYDYKGQSVVYADTDSEISTTIHQTNVGPMSVEGLFELCSIKWADGEKEYATDDRLTTLTYDPRTNRALMKPFNYVYRHRVRKPKWRIRDEFGNEVIVTGDHSVMVERDGDLVEIKPRDLGLSDTLVGFDTTVTVDRSKVVSVEMIGEFEDEYVYDIGIDEETPYFFGNGILLHNSSYFSAYECLKDHPDYAGFEWSRENVVALYDAIADEVNASFPEFMMKAFNTTFNRGKIIQAGRELVASRGLFIKKKKYAVLMFDKEGERLDKNGKPGKLKAMGLDLKRADTPKYMQEFLENLLMDILTGAETEAMFEDIRRFREGFKDRPGWEKGTPKKINGYSFYADADLKARTASVERTVKKGEKTKINMPGHVRAAINWNLLCELNQDRHAMRLSDGAKAVVCKLRPNVYNMDSVAYPIDEPHLPQWYRDLPFDDTAMEETIIDFKLENLVGVLEWDLRKTKNRDDDEFFVFG